MDTQAKQITEQLDVVTEIPSSIDVLFVFGTRLAEPALIAADYMNKGVARYVVLTGGKNPNSGVDEAEAHLKILLSRNVPRDQIVLEDKSTNTLQNVIYAIPKLMKGIGQDSISSVGVIAKWYHCRRAMMTLKRHLPIRVRYFALTYEPEGIGRSNWWQTAEGRERVLGEWECISPYLAQGDIENIHESDGSYV